MKGIIAKATRMETSQPVREALPSAGCGASSSFHGNTAQSGIRGTLRNEMGKGEHGSAVLCSQSHPGLPQRAEPSPTKLEDSVTGKIN